jgi:Fe-S cluster biogenesis protein NfuA
MSSAAEQIEQCKKEIAEFKAQIEAHRGDPEVDQPRTSTRQTAVNLRGKCGALPPCVLRR